MKDSMSQNKITTINLLILLLLVTYILLRIIYIPITHDEAATILHILPNSYLDIFTYNYSYISGNNHILNSLGTKIFTQIFGQSLIAIRFSSLIGFVLCFITLIYTFSDYFKTKHFTLVIISLFFANPFLIEFFGLCRGYGMSICFTIIAACFSKLYYDASHPKNEIYLLAIIQFSWLLAILSNFVAIYVFISFQMLLCLTTYLTKNQKFEKITFIAFTSLCTFNATLPALSKLTKAGDMHFFGNGTFWNDTVMSFFKSFFLNEHIHSSLVIAICVFVLVVFSFLIFKFSTLSFKYTGFEIIAIFWLPCTIGINFVLTKVFDSSWLTTRTTLIYAPLIAFLLVVFIKVIEEVKLLKFLPIILSLLLSLHLLLKGNIHSSYEWAYDQDNLKVLELLSKEHTDRKENSPLGFKAYCLNQPSLQVHANIISPNLYKSVVGNIAELPRSIGDSINFDADYYYVLSEYKHKFQQLYNPIFVSQDSQRILFKRMSK